MTTATMSPDVFRTPFDALPANRDYATAQYAKGLAMAREGWEIHIAATGVWSARMAAERRPDGTVVYRHIASVEVLGLHACTADLVRGWLDGGATIIDHRRPRAEAAAARDSGLDNHTITC